MVSPSPTGCPTSPRLVNGSFHTSSHHHGRPSTSSATADMRRISSLFESSLGSLTAASAETRAAAAGAAHGRRRKRAGTLLGAGANADASATKHASGGAAR
jgi:hypothetical protein